MSSFKESIIVSINNLTGETMRDIILTYDGDKSPIEILKIKNEYEKIVFLHMDDDDELFNLKLLYDEKEYIVYKNIDVKSEINIKLTILKDKNKEIDIKSYLYIR